MPSKTYLAARRKRITAAADKQISPSAHIGLEQPRPGLRKKTLWRIVPRFVGLHNAGDDMKLGDDVMLVNPSSNMFLTIAGGVTDLLEVSGGPFKSFWRVEPFSSVSETSQWLRVCLNALGSYC